MVHLLINEQGPLLTPAINMKTDWYKSQTSSPEFWWHEAAVQGQWTREKCTRFFEGQMSLLRQIYWKT